MNDTPRTDEAEPVIKTLRSQWVRADFARDLERELTAALAERDKWRKVADEMAMYARELGRYTNPGSMTESAVMLILAPYDKLKGTP